MMKYINSDEWLKKKLRKLARKRKRKEKNRRRGKQKKIDPFYSTQEWKTIRYKVLVRDKATCQCCGRSAKDGFMMNVDHIKPRRKYPELALLESNLQVLCADCNRGKLEWDMTDWTADPLMAEWREKIAAE